MRLSFAALSILAAGVVPSAAFAADYPEDDSYREHSAYERSYDRREEYDEPSYDEERVVVRRPAPVVRRVYVDEPAPAIVVGPAFYGPRYVGPRRWYGPRRHWAHHRRW